MNDLHHNLRQVAAELFIETPVLFAYLYGSYSRGTPHKFSDLDIAIYVEGLSLKENLELQLWLSIKMDER